jgi:hypothetical protein
VLVRVRASSANPVDNAIAAGMLAQMVEHDFPVTPQAYRHLAGPYNRRNVYGAVMAAGPILATNARTAPMFDSVAAYALCGRAPLLRELGLDPHEMAVPPHLRYEPRAGAPGSVARRLSVPCA